MGNVTVAIKRRYYPDGGKAVVADVTGSSSYATGGDSYTNAQFDMYVGADAIVDGGTSGYVLVPDLANKKIKFMRPGVASTPLVEETAATNLSTVTGRVIVFGENINI